MAARNSKVSVQQLQAPQPQLTVISNSNDTIYQHDQAHIAQLRKDAPFDSNPTYFKHCKLSTLATMKMLKHALLGVTRGQLAGTPPQEIMGLMIGKPSGDTLIIFDVAPLPVTGTETRVVADDIDTQMQMINICSSVEQNRQNSDNDDSECTVIGWYHSHPFDYDASQEQSYSHCHLSNTDVMTQQNWQSTSPLWLSIVVDPLRSVALAVPQLGAYRVYNQSNSNSNSNSGSYTRPAYLPPANECPDGSVSTSDAARVLRWGHSHAQYYALDISYFQSDTATAVLAACRTPATAAALWSSVLSTPATASSSSKHAQKAEATTALTQMLKSMQHRLQASEYQLTVGGGRANKRGGYGSSNNNASQQHADDAITSVSVDATAIGVAAAKSCCSLQVKRALFNFQQAQITVQQQQQQIRAQQAQETAAT